MRSVFELAKICFFLCIVVLAMLHLQGGTLIDEAYADELLRLAIPALIVLGGLVVGWILAVFFSDNLKPDHPMLVRGFVVGIILGAIGALLYVFFFAGKLV